MEDVWALPTPGGPDDFPRMLALFRTLDPAHSSPVVRILFDLRWKIGGVLGWDGDEPRGDGFPFTELYEDDDEWAGEIANATMSGVCHLGWVEDGAGGYRGQMAVLVKPNGWFGRAYMAAILPFRHLLVYPLLLKEVERTWREA